MRVGHVDAGLVLDDVVVGGGQAAHEVRHGGHRDDRTKAMVEIGDLDEFDEKPTVRQKACATASPPTGIGTRSWATAKSGCGSS